MLSDSVGCVGYTRTPEDVKLAGSRIKRKRCDSPFSRPGWGARGGGGCAGCLWARERYAMSALRLFHNIEARKLEG